MKNIILRIVILMISITLYGQNIESSTRKFIKDAQITRINKIWTIIAEFNSGIGESVQFYPIEVINLKTGEKTKALQLDMNLKNPPVFKTVWIGIEEINEFITFIENYVMPNLELKLRKKTSSEFIFNAKEMRLSLLISEKRKRLTIKLNDYDDNYTFWTETQVDRIPKMLEILKIIK